MNKPSFGSVLRRSIVVSFVALAMSVGGPVQAQETPEGPSISSDRAVQLAIAQNPSLRAAIYSLQSARNTTESEVNRYPYSVTLSGGVTRTDTPSLNSSQNYLEAAAELSRTFATGTKAAVRLNGYRDNRSDANGASSPYTTSARLSVAQPLLRGAGRQVGEQQLRIARINERIAEYYRDRAASELVRDVLVAYWEFWYTNSAVQIEYASRALAVTQRDDAKVKAEQGLLPPVDILTYETRLSTLDESLLQAKGNRRQAALSLIQTIGARDLLQNSSISASEASPPSFDQISRTSALELAIANSPELIQREQDIRLAEEQLRVAGDSVRSRLDLEAYLQLARQGASSTQQLDPATSATATSAHVGLVYELPLNDPRRSLARSSALLAVSSAQENLRQVKQRILLEMESVLQEEENAKQRLSLAEQTSLRAEAQYQAERERFAAGITLAIQIQLAQDEVRKAKLRTERARVDLCEAQIRRSHLIGALLKQIPAEALAAVR